MLDGATTTTSPAPAPAAGETRDYDVEDGDDAIDDGFEDGADSVDDGHEAGADGLEDGFDLLGVEGLVWGFFLGGKRREGGLGRGLVSGEGVREEGILWLFVEMVNMICELNMESVFFWWFLRFMLRKVRVKCTGQITVCPCMT